MQNYAKENLKDGAGAWVELNFVCRRWQAFLKLNCQQLLDVSVNFVQFASCQ